ncbi:hypothetical protein GY45DRAFT_555759 [Cubamyces sp. BRFM 1775]|nr:hypothetical protein GY45DRAFT_555759 [Cubamyces sp. BRFM 1775]
MSASFNIVSAPFYPAYRYYDCSTDNTMLDDYPCTQSCRKICLDHSRTIRPDPYAVIVDAENTGLQSPGQAIYHRGWHCAPHATYRQQEQEQVWSQSSGPLLDRPQYPHVLSSGEIAAERDARWPMVSSGVTAHFPQFPPLPPAISDGQQPSLHARLPRAETAWSPDIPAVFDSGQAGNEPSYQCAERTGAEAPSHGHIAAYTELRKFPTTSQWIEHCHVSAPSPPGYQNALCEGNILQPFVPPILILGPAQTQAAGRQPAVMHAVSQEEEEMHQEPWLLPLRPLRQAGQGFGLRPAR